MRAEGMAMVDFRHYCSIQGDAPRSKLSQACVAWQGMTLHVPGFAPSRPDLLQTRAGTQASLKPATERWARVSLHETMDRGWSWIQSET